MARTNRTYETYQGKPCKHGHSGIRFVAGRACVECAREKSAQFRQRQGMKPQAGYSRGGWRPHYLYGTWEDIIQRCEDPNCKAFKNYGGRGIKICDRWRYSFETFLADILSEIGERPNGHTLDRIDSDGHYQPGNMRWATPTTQARNRRVVKLSMEQAREIRDLHAMGVSLRDVAAAYGVNESTTGRIVHNKIWKE